MTDICANCIHFGGRSLGYHLDALKITEPCLNPGSPFHCDECAHDCRCECFSRIPWTEAGENTLD